MRRIDEAKNTILVWLAGALVVLSAQPGTVSAADRVRYDDKNQRDPFEPLVTLDGRILPGARGAAQAELEHVILEGIIWDAQGKSVAIINGKLAKELDTVQGYQVLKIKKESVILQRGGRVITVGLQKKGGGNGQ